MDKQKQIEEMAQCKNFSGTICSNCGVKAGCDRYTLAEELYNAGYRKIPEGAVVLTGEEHNKLRADSYNLKRLYEQYPYRVLVVFNSMVFSQDHENYEKLFDDIEKRIAEEIRNEAVAKFAEMLKDLVAERNCNENYDWEDVQIDGQIFVECVDEIAKELTEGKK